MDRRLATLGARRKTGGSASARPSIVGLSYRFDVASGIEATLPELDIVEIVLDQYLGATDRYRDHAHALVGRVPIVGHGARLSLGTACLPDPAYVDSIAYALDRLGARQYSEHIAFTRVPGIEIDELLPVPRTDESLETLVRNIAFVKSRIGVPLLVENVSRVFDYPVSDYSEAGFVNRICREAGVGLLLDLENAYANQLNFGEDARAFVAEIDQGLVGAIHLAGGEWQDGTFIDDHGHDIPDPVLELLEASMERHGVVAAIVERDRNYSDAGQLMSEVRRVRARQERVLGRMPNACAAS